MLLLPPPFAYLYKCTMTIPCIITYTKLVKLVLPPLLRQYKISFPMPFSLCEFVYETIHLVILSIKPLYELRNFPIYVGKRLNERLNVFSFMIV